MRKFWRHGRMLFSQFPILTTARLLAMDVARTRLDRHSVLSYSQTGEDLIIDFYLRQCESSYYVDIGCHQPFAMSNTMRFYRQGWRGLCVDGNPDLIAAFRKARPRDVCVCACVSNRAEAASFVVPESTAMATLSKEFEGDYLKGDADRKRVMVNTVTAQSLFEAHHVPKSFALLSIDVEGHDFEVPTSFDLNTYRPKLIVTTKPT
jgi:FkbM family methyltransferase